MILKELKPRKALNKAFLKVKPNRTEIEVFKTNLITLLDRTNDTESEEFHKNLVSDFLKDTYYKQNHFINTKGRNDLVIHNGPQASTTVGVILEAKKPTNKAEMISIKRLNAKAFQELVLYYLRERITHKNLEVKHLVATNINEWFIFDATVFDRLFAQNKNLVKQFNDFEGGRLADTKTDFFYKQIAEPFIDQMLATLPSGGLEFTYFNIQDFQKPLRNTDKADDNALIALFKLLSPEHLLKLPFTNDSNSLDKRFYSELLHIIGLTETKEGSKKLIERNKAGERHTGTILEDAIIQLDSLDKLSRLEKPSQYGNTQQERLFNVALELSITWINRILFLKLLEAQLITYHRGDKSYSFLNLDKITNYDDLNSLFFQVLARRYDERNEDVKKIFEKVPYLNSSLFEPTAIEQDTLFISNLKDHKTIPIFSQTMLKDQQGKKRTGNISTLQYLFEFLDAYDFGAEGGEEIQEDNKTLINASVLGLIFEKINGYKDGSFFTPGFITMYMCRETIRKAVVQKFNEALNSLTPSPSPRGRGEMDGLTPSDFSKSRGEMDGLRSSSVSERRGEINALTPSPSPRGRGEQPRIELQGQKINPELLEHARGMRKNETPAEEFMWNLLRNRRFLGYKFRRQHPVAQKFILDFFCDELRLGLELDGEYHSSQDQKEYDEGRTYELEEFGIQIIRFTNQEVLWETEKVLETIRDFANARASHSPHSPHSPLSFGRGAGGEGDNSQREIKGKVQSREPKIKDLDELYDFIGPGGVFSYKEANEIINSIKICDPAVGSGHFLVSALNEMIAVKSDLKILQDRDGKRLKEYQVEVVNDELIVTDEEGELFEYKPYNKESQRVQEALFHEKQTIIENCLFGVDINPNSVKICRLRLWIELLKNAYYKNAAELETLPNIDINIKCGNSLVSRFAIDADLRQALKKSKWTIDSYKLAVDRYRNAESKEEKREMERLIGDIKSDFRSEITKNDPKIKRKAQLAGELYNLTMQQGLFAESEKQKAERMAKVAKLEDAINKLETEIEEIKANKIFENAFEWRFEFPEVLNDEGDFVGFDGVIGNPPYFSLSRVKEQSEYFSKANYVTYSKGADIYCLFYELGGNILKPFGLLTYITSNSWLRAIYGELLKRYFIEKLQPIALINIEDVQIFEEATVESNIITLQKSVNSRPFQVVNLSKDYTTGDSLNEYFKKYSFEFIPPSTSEWFIGNQSVSTLKRRIENGSKLLKDFNVRINFGIKTGYNEAFIIDEKKRNELVEVDARSGDIIMPILRGRDLKKYFYEHQNLWVIATFPSLRIDIESYPAIKNHFVEIGKKRLEQSGEDGSRKKTSNKWFETQDSISYWSDFEKPKIVWGEISDKPKFAFDDDKYYAEATTFLMTGEKLKFLLAILNSKVSEWYFNLIGTTTGMGTNRWKKYKIELLPIKIASRDQETEIESLVDQILAIKKQNPTADTTALENQIDQLVYQLYGLTEEEIKIIENA